MTPRHPSTPAHYGGPTTVDALLEACRPLAALSPVGHDRVKRRLSKSLARWTAPHARWLKPLVVTTSLLLGGVASGLALDRIVLRPAIDVDVTAGGPTPARGRAAGQAGQHRTPSPHPLPPAAEAPVAAAPELEGSPLAAPSVPIENKPLVTPTPTRRLAMASPKILNEQPQSLVPVEPAPRAPHPMEMPARREEAASIPARAAIPVPSPEPTAAPALTPARPMRPWSAAAMVPPQPIPTRADGPSEERMLAAAVRALRSLHDASSALTTLDEYRTRYPQGRLAVEASALRVDALLALDRRDEAMRVLDTLTLAQVPGGSERQLQRAELRAWAGRQPEAIADFDAVLARSGDNATAERALWGRAQARLAGGDRTGAQRDAVLYLQRHPTGRFAVSAARLAGASP